MPTKFKQWIDTASAGTNVQSQTDFNGDTQRANGFQSGTAASSIRVNTALREATLITTALMDTLAPNSNVDVTSSVTDVKTAIGNKSASQSGTDLTFVTTGEKYTWNHKSDFSGDYNDLINKPNFGDVWYLHECVYIDVPQGAQAAGSYLVSFISNKDSTDIVNGTAYDLTAFINKFEILNLERNVGAVNNYTTYDAHLIVNVTPTVVPDAYSKAPRGILVVGSTGLETIGFDTYYEGVTIRWTANSTVTPLNNFYTTDQTMPVSNRRR